jgi:hypothetical protein
MKSKTQISPSPSILYGVAALLLVALVSIISLPVFAASTGSVAATVTTQNISAA